MQSGSTVAMYTLTRTSREIITKTASKLRSQDTSALARVVCFRSWDRIDLEDGSLGLEAGILSWKPGHKRYHHEREL